MLILFLTLQASSSGWPMAGLTTGELRSASTGVGAQCVTTALVTKTPLLCVAC